MSVAKKRRGRVAGSEGYSSADVAALLGCVERVLPVGNQDWEAVLQRYRESYATPNQRALRDVTSIRNKFRLLTPAQKPTGNPSRPTAVAKAFAIEAAIKEKVAFSSLSDDPDQANATTICTQLGIDSDTDINNAIEDHEDNDDDASGSDLLLEENPEVGDDEAAQDTRPPPTAHVVRQQQDRSAPTTQPAVKPTRAPSKRKAPPASTSHQSMASAIHEHLFEQGRQREVSSAEKFMRLQLEAANASLQYERSERKTLAKKVERLEGKLESLIDQKERLRDRIFTLESENRRLQDRRSPIHQRSYPVSGSPYRSRSSTNSHSPFRQYRRQYEPYYGRNGNVAQSWRSDRYEQPPAAESLYVHAARGQPDRTVTDSGVASLRTHDDRFSEDAEEKQLQL